MRLDRLDLRTSLALAIALAAGAPAARAQSVADRAAHAAGGEVVHEIDGTTVVVRGTRAAGAAVEMATGARAVVAGAGPLRLTGAREDAAIAALTPGERQALEAALRGARAGAEAAGEDAVAIHEALLAAAARVGAGAGGGAGGGGGAGAGGGGAGGATSSATTATARAQTSYAAAASSASYAQAASAYAQASAAGYASTSAASAIYHGPIWGVPAQPRPATPPAGTGAAHRPGFFDTTEFLSGRVAVNVVFVNGPKRQWSQDDKSDAVSDLVEALDMWQQEFPLAYLSFKYRTFTVSSPIEPIENSADARDTWVEAAMEQVGSAPHDAGAGWMRPYLNTYELDNSARATLGTDWACTFFMVRAANGIGDAWSAATGGVNGTFMFADGTPAFTMLGGPYSVMPYSKILGVHFWNVPILTHEFGHLWYALDEYPSYAAKGHTASETSGYFNGSNGNLQGPGEVTDDTCIMRGSFKAVLDYVLDHIVSIFTFGATSSWDYSVCGYTRTAIGYRDQDRDGRLDPFDAAPTPWISAVLNTDGSGNVTVLANVEGSVGAAANQNAYSGEIHPASAKKDVSLDSIYALYVSVNGAPWVKAASGALGTGGPADLTGSVKLPAARGTTAITVWVGVSTSYGEWAQTSVVAR